MRPGIQGLLSGPARPRPLHPDAGRDPQSRLIVPVDETAPALSGTAQITQASSVTASGGGTRTGTASITQAHTVTGTPFKGGQGPATITQAHTVTAAGQKIITASGSAQITQPTATTGTGKKSGAGTAATTTASDVPAPDGEKAARGVAGSATATSSATATGVQVRTGQALVIVNHTTSASGVKQEAPAQISRRGGRRPRFEQPDETPPTQTASGRAHLLVHVDTSAQGHAARAGISVTGSASFVLSQGRAARRGTAQSSLTAVGSGRGRARHTERQRREDELLFIGAI